MGEGFFHIFRISSGLIGFKVARVRLKMYLWFYLFGRLADAQAFTAEGSGSKNCIGKIISLYIIPRFSDGPAIMDGSNNHTCTCPEEWV